MYDVEFDEFAEMVRRAVVGLPDEFAERLANIEFVVEDYATRDDYVRTHTPRGATLLGVYRGVPLTRRGAGYNLTLPDRIVIFRRPLQRLAADHADLDARVRHVVRHEVAHYFGISDDRLREIDAY